MNSDELRLNVEKALEEIRLQEESKEFSKGSLLPRRRTYGKAKKNVYFMN